MAANISNRAFGRRAAAARVAAATGVVAAAATLGAAALLAGCSTGASTASSAKTAALHARLTVTPSSSTTTPSSPTPETAAGTGAADGAGAATVAIDGAGTNAVAGAAPPPQAPLATSPAAPDPSVIAHDEAQIAALYDNCIYLGPGGCQGEFTVATTPDGAGGLVYAIELGKDGMDSCSWGDVYFFDGERLITASHELVPHAQVGYNGVSSPGPGEFAIKYIVNPSVSTFCYQYGTAGIDTYVYRWSGSAITLVSGQPPNPPLVLG